MVRGENRKREEAKERMTAASRGLNAAKMHTTKRIYVYIYSMCDRGE